MRILLTNDDGLHAPGIAAMYDALMNAGSCDGAFAEPMAVEVVPIAPLTVQSATSHGVTFHQPLMTSQRQVNEHMSGIAVDGRPADCVKLALASLWQERFGAGTRPDLLVSGINSGANCGINVIYSGTVAAALEAAFLGVPAIAVSLHLGRDRPRYDVAARHARRAIEQVLEAGHLAPHACLNINIPICEADGPMPPVTVCPMNTHGLNDQYVRRVSPAGDVYYWSSGNGFDFHTTDEGSDVQALFDRSITVTPLRYDLTDHTVLPVWRGGLGGGL